MRHKFTTYLDSVYSVCLLTEGYHLLDVPLSRGCVCMHMCMLWVFVCMHACAYVSVCMYACACVHN